MEQAKAMSQAFLAADPNDTRAGNDLIATLENQALCYENRLEGTFAEEPADPSADAASALQSLSEARSVTEHLLQIEPDNVHWRSALGLILIRISQQQRALHRTEGNLELAAKGVAMLKAVGKLPNAQGFEIGAGQCTFHIKESVAALGELPPHPAHMESPLARRSALVRN